MPHRLNYLRMELPPVAHHLPVPVKQRLRSLQRSLCLRPMHFTIREIQRRGVRLQSMTALSVFGGSGERQTLDLAPFVGSLEAWEINPELAASLQRRLLTATVKVVDSYEEIKRTARRYELIACDNPDREHGGHYEHFDLIADMFRVAAEEAVLIVLVIPWYTTAFQKAGWWDGFTPEHLARRRAFYRTETPEHVPFDHMVAVYGEIARRAGFSVEWFFVRKTAYSYYDLVLKIRRAR